ncbi:hypothetical protein B0H16DRAFT_1475506 [Mycena metata]|uniref:Uncharacterized protein n=1 Tax=Mycena metata TaxID=1033252 RepID=A0AAD7HF50_9AGAR|nr:hypothetical protein B0H16DRAFT_1475506 [Mycena metata]
MSSSSFPRFLGCGGCSELAETAAGQNAGRRWPRRWEGGGEVEGSLQETFKNHKASGAFGTFGDGRLEVLCDAQCDTSFRPFFLVPRPCTTSFLATFALTMSENLPDEIISEILSPTLKHFIRITFRLFSSSSSSTLLVCKSWLRVATPLLYSFVIIRSKAQANALQLTLQTNPQLGNFVKHLRVENGYGMTMHHILAQTPNIVHIVLSLRIQDSSAGLVKGLPLINPTTLSIIDETEFFLKNQAVMKVVATIESCTKKWKNLTNVHFPYTGPLGIRGSLCIALCACPTVQVVSWPIYNRYVAPSIVQLSQYPNLKVVKIRVKPESKPTHRRFLLPESPTPEVKDPRLCTLILWEDTPCSMTSIDAADLDTFKVVPRDPSFRPLVSSPQKTVDRIWSRVLFFAMLSLEQHPQDVPPTELMDEKINGARLRFLLVSRLFCRLALPHLYRYPILPTEAILGAFTSSLVQYPTLGDHIRDLDIRIEENARYSHNAPSGTESLARILLKTPNLTRLIGTIPRRNLWDGTEPISIGWAELSSLANRAGRTLHEFTGFTISSARTEPTLLSPVVFNDFHALRSFTWKTRYSGNLLNFKAVDQRSAGAFPALEFLDIQSPEALTVFAQMRLPSLRRLALNNDGDWDGKIMRAHGSKIEFLQVCRMTIDGQSIFKLCPNMTTLCWQPETVYKQIPDFGCGALEKDFEHKSLTKIILDRDYPIMNKRDEENWHALFSAIDVPCLPALREVCVPWCTWPTVERDIKKSLWVNWAEVLLERGIKMTDRAGKEWAPRLKTSRR